MRIDREMRKAVQNSLLSERFRAERIIEAEGGFCASIRRPPQFAVFGRRHLDQR